MGHFIGAPNYFNNILQSALIDHVNQTTIGTQNQISLSNRRKFQHRNLLAAKGKTQKLAITKKLHDTHTQLANHREKFDHTLKK
jgi:hypothetical protein